MAEEVWGKSSYQPFPCFSILSSSFSLAEERVLGCSEYRGSGVNSCGSLGGSISGSGSGVGGNGGCCNHAGSNNYGSGKGGKQQH